MSHASAVRQSSNTDGRVAACGTYAADLWREATAGLEWLELRWSATYAGSGVPQGDGSPVILVPGFLATDASLVELRMWLGRNGYAAQRSGIGLNARCPRELVDVLARTVERVYASSGRRVTLIGHSLGGLLARGVALRRPDAVARVITLGSPVQGLRAHAAIAAAAQILGRACDASCLLSLQRVLPASVAETNIFSARDAVVDPATCVRDDAPSVEVRGSHVGLVVNVEVYRHLARILAVRPQRRVTPERIARLHHAPRREQLAA